MVTQENLQRLRLRFACKRLLAKFRLNLLNSQQLCFERRSSQLTCRRLGFNSLNWCNSLALSFCNTSILCSIVVHEVWPLQHKTCVEALESHKAEAATLRKRLQEHHKQFICEPMIANGGSINGVRGQNLLARRALRVMSRRWSAFPSREDSSKSKGAGPEESGTLSQFICSFWKVLAKAESGRILRPDVILGKYFCLFLEAASE